jgi:hypothetical protein
MVPKGYLSQKSLASHGMTSEIEVTRQALNTNYEKAFDAVG